MAMQRPPNLPVFLLTKENVFVIDPMPNAFIASKVIDSIKDTPFKLNLKANAELPA